MDLGAASFRITAGISGQQALDRLTTSIGSVNEHVGKLPGLAKSAGLALAGLGAGVSLAVLTAKFDDTVRGMLAIKDAAEKTGTSVEKFGALAAAARITGDDVATLEAGIIRMNKALAGADDEAKGAAHALDAIGLKIADLRRMDPADAFSKIAYALDGFADSGGKTALVLDIFGKSGAQLLPFLKDYVEIGEQASRVTQQQAEDAEAYDRALRRLAAAKEGLYRVISAQLLPVATDFVQALLDVTNGTNGVKDAARGLAADGTMTKVFREAAKAAAAFLDVLDVVFRGIKQIGESFAVVWKDISTAAQLAMTAPKAMSNALLWRDFTGVEQVQKLVDERNAYVEAANKRMAERFAGGLTPYSDALNARFMARDTPTVPQPSTRSDALRAYQSRDVVPPKPAAEKAEKADPFETALAGLGRDAARYQWQSEHIAQYAERIDSAREAQMRFDVEQGKFKDLSEGQKAVLIMAAQQVDRYAEALRQAQVGLEYQRQTQAINANTSALGLNAQQREMVAAAQDLENKGIKQGAELYAKLIEARQQAIEAAYAAKQNPFLGLTQGFNELADRVNDRAGQMKDLLVSTFDRAADAMAEFTLTGKLNFKDFARSVVADLAKMIAKQSLFNLLKTGVNLVMGGGGAGGAPATDLGQFFAKGGAFGSAGVRAFASGGVVSSPTLFRFAEGGMMRAGLMGEAGPEAILPLRRGPDGRLGVTAAWGGGSVTVNVAVDASGRQQGAADEGNRMAQLGKVIASVVRAEIVQQQRPGGLLAA